MPLLLSCFSLVRVTLLTENVFLFIYHHALFTQPLARYALLHIHEPKRWRHARKSTQVSTVSLSRATVLVDVKRLAWHSWLPGNPTVMTGLIHTSPQRVVFLFLRRYNTFTELQMCWLVLNHHLNLSSDVITLIR